MHGYDFFDFGCSDGANIKFIQKIDSGLRGLGIDIDSKKIEAAKANNLQALNYDILKIPSEKIVDFVTMSHFLEHLPSTKVAGQMIEKACEVGREFVLIRQPWFDSDGFLPSHKLKLYWSDWTGHPNRMTTLDFYLILRLLIIKRKITSFQIFGRTPIKSSADACIIPIETATNQHHYNFEVHGNKIMNLVFDSTIYREIIVLINIKENVSISKFINPLGPLTPILKIDLNQG